MSDLEELTDEEKMMNLLEELQTENEQLRAKVQPLEPLLQTIRQQEQEITRLNSSLIGERKQNEKLLELAKNEKKLHEENEKLKREIAKLKSENNNLGLNYKLEKDKSENLQDQLNKATKLNITDDLQRFTVALKSADDKSRDIMLVHYINLAVVAVFVILAIGSGYLSHNASKSAEKTYNAVQNGIYDKDGWSMIPGAYLNEYTTATQRPDAYASYKQQHPEQAHY